MDCSFGKALFSGTLRFPPPAPLPNSEQPMPYCIVADDAFPLHPNIMKPFLFQNKNVSQRVFQYRLSRAWRIIENTFGIASTRFRVLRRTNELPPEKVKSIVDAICVLHNFMLTRNSRRVYTPNGIFDYDNDDGTTLPGAWRNLEHEGMNDLKSIIMRNPPLLAKQVR